MNTFQGIKNKTDLFILGGLAAVYCLFNYLWVIHESRPPHWDMGRHLWTSLLYLQQLHFKTFYRLWTNYYFYPPFRYWVTIPFYLLFGTSMTVAIMSNVVFVAIMAFSVYGIGLELWNRSTGLLASLFVLSMPIFASQFKEYQLDAQLSAMVALSLYLLIKTHEFSDRRFSFLFGLSFGLGMLTKWTFFLSMALPLAYALWRAVRAPSPARENNLKNIKWSALVAFGVSILWYGNHPRMLKNDLLGNGFKGEDAPWHSLEALFWYPERLETIQLYLLPTCMLAAGLALTLVRKHRPNIYPLLLILGSYFLSLPLHKDVRYTMPMLVGASILGVYWIPLITAKVTRRLLLTLWIAYCAFSFWGTSFGFGFMPKETHWGPLMVFNQGGYSTAAPPTTGQWHQEEIFRIISAYPEKDRSLKSDCLDTQWFNNWGLMYYALRYDVQLTFEEKNTAFLLERSDKPLPTRSNFEIVRQFTLPDNTVLRLSKRTKPA